MRLIGMLDSPYVRRVAISLTMMGYPFKHESVSVFRHYAEFAAINPVVKAPTLVTDDGLVLMESSLILDHVERQAPPERRLMPENRHENARAQRLLGLALAACEKSVQLVYEFTLRPAEKRHQPWIDRVEEQLRVAYRLLEGEMAPANPWLFSDRPLQPEITAAVAWQFTQSVVPQTVSADQHPALCALSRRAEALDAFVALPPE